MPKNKGKGKQTKGQPKVKQVNKKGNPIAKQQNHKKQEAKKQNSTSKFVLQRQPATNTGSKLSPLQEQMKAKLDGAQFRWINEQLYTTTGTEALELLQANPEYFDIYHKGFRSQVEKWPENPVDIIISWLKSQPKSMVVADLGCGEAKIAKTVPHKVYSFDLVAANESVTACDISSIPLENQTVDIVVFCLSLMGTNVADFLKEANRIMKNGGTLKIAEVKSRIPDQNKFIEFANTLGFKLKQKNEANKMFVLYTMTKYMNELPKELPPFEFKPCLYKKR